MIVEDDLKYEEYMDLINSVGWKYPSKRLLEKSLKNSVTVKYVLDDKTVGMARFVTDYGYVGLIIDVIVKPGYQGQGIGKKLIQNIIDRVKENLEEDEQMMIQLLAAPGKKGFYEQFGFKEKKTTAEAGMYMWLGK